MAYHLSTALLVFGMLTAGTVNTLTRKYAYNTESLGDTTLNHDPNHYHKFRKPWTMTLFMFFGEFICLAVFFGKVWLQRRKTAKLQRKILEDSPLLPQKLSETRDDQLTPSTSVFITLKSSLVCFIPAACDVIASITGGIGLLYTTSSVYQLLRGSLILFTGLLSVWLLKRRQQPYHWMGMLISTAGVIIVGVSSVFQSGDARVSNAAGVILCTIGTMATAVQIVVEEKYLKQRNLPPELAVGAEGFFGMAILLCVLLPIVAHIPGNDGDGVRENVIDAAVMLSHSGRLQGLVIGFFLAVGIFNLCGLAIAKSLSAIHRTLIDTIRSVAVWSADVAIYYMLHGSQYGEKWEGKWSGIQLIGFACIIIGAFTYYRVIKLPWFPYEDHADSGTLNPNDGAADVTVPKVSPIQSEATEIELSSS